MNECDGHDLTALLADNDQRKLDFWREAMANLRQLHNDVWNGVRFFLALNAIVFAGIATVIFQLQEGYQWYWAIDLIILGTIGVMLTWMARCILRKHREYYLEMLVKKTLIEEFLGFYSTSLAVGVNASFTWSVPFDYVGRLKLDPKAWAEERLRPKGRITGWLFRFYDVLVGIHAVIIIGSLATLPFIEALTN